MKSRNVPMTDQLTWSTRISKKFLPSVFIILLTCFGFVVRPRQSIGMNLAVGILGGLLLVGIGSGGCQVFRNSSPIWARRVGVFIYWLFAVVGFILSGYAVYAAYEGAYLKTAFILFVVGALYWVIGYGARLALTPRHVPASTPDEMIVKE
jgi:xanthine/uracil/vitamin C permease (AzgA family)